MEDYNTEYDLSLSSEWMKKLDQWLNRWQAGQYHLMNRGRHRKVPRRPNKWSQQKTKTTVVAYRRNKLCLPWFRRIVGSVQHLVPIVSCSHSPYPKTMMLIFKTTGYYTKDGLVFLEIFYNQKKCLCYATTPQLNLVSKQDAAGQPLVFF